MEEEIKPTDLVKGVTYKIVHKNGKIRERFGVFDGPTPNENANANENESVSFTNIRGANVRSFPFGAYRIDEWKFLKSVDPPAAAADDPQPLTDGGRRRRRKTRARKHKRVSRKTRRSRK